MSGAELDWEDDSTVCVRNQDAVAVFVNVRGEIAIRQQNWPEDDSLVLFHPEHAQAVIEAIARAADLAGIPVSIPQLGEQSNSNAERQRRYRQRRRNVTRDGKSNGEAVTLTPQLLAAE